MPCACRVQVDGEGNVVSARLALESEADSFTAGSSSIVVTPLDGACDEPVPAGRRRLPPPLIRGHVLEALHLQVRRGHLPQDTGAPSAKHVHQLAHGSSPQREAYCERLAAAAWSLCEGRERDPMPRDSRQLALSVRAVAQHCAALCVGPLACRTPSTLVSCKQKAGARARSCAVALEMPSHGIRPCAAPQQEVLRSSQQSTLLQGTRAVTA